MQILSDPVTVSGEEPQGHCASEKAWQTKNRKSGNLPELVCALLPMKAGCTSVPDADRVCLPCLKDQASFFFGSIPQAA